MNDKAEELTTQHNNQLSALQAKASQELHARAIAEMESDERQKIEATERGSVMRLAVIESAIKTEETLGLQSTVHYRELLTQRVQAQREMGDESRKLAAQAGKEEANQELAMGQLALAAIREKEALENSVRHISIQMRKDQELKAAEDEFLLKNQTLKKEMSSLNQGEAEYQNKLRALQNKELQLIKAHENEKTAITERAEKDREANILSAQRRAEKEMSSSLTDLITGHRTFAQMVQQYSQQAAGSLIQLAIASLDANERTKMSDAGQAARDAFKSTMKAFPSPFNLIAAPIAGASAFTAMMAFERGTDYVQGMGRGDVVPAMLTPGEGVVPGGVMDGLRTMARAGTMGASTHYLVQAHYAPQVHAIDAIGVDRMLDKHGDRFQRHLETTLRKFNR